MTLTRFHCARLACTRPVVARAMISGTGGWVISVGTCTAHLCATHALERLYGGARWSTAFDQLYRHAIVVNLRTPGR